MNRRLLITLLWLTAAVQAIGLFFALTTLAQADRSILVPGSLTGGTQTAPVALHYLTTPYSGPLIQEDANTVAHVTFSNSGGNATLSDTKANTWTLNGTVPSFILGPFYPGGFSGSAKVETGTTNSTNNFSLGTGSDVLDFSGDFTAYFIFSLSSGFNGNFNGLFIDANAMNGSPTSGYYIQLQSGSNVLFVTSGGSISISGTPVPFGPNIIAIGRAGSTIYGELNGGAVTSGAGGAITPATAYPARLGSDGGSFTFSGIAEFMATSSTWNTVTVTNTENQVLSQLTEQYLPLTVTRSSTATDTVPTGEATSCASPPCLFTWPSNVARVSSNGIVAEPASTNLIQYSEQFDNAAWTKTNVTVTANSTQAPDGNTTADTIQGTSNGDKVESSTTTAAAAVYTASVWVTGANQLFDLRIRDTTAGTDLQACNGKTATQGTLTRVTCTSAGSATSGHVLAIDIYPGQAGGVGTIKAWGAQLEQHSFATEYIATTNAAASRSADQISASVPEGGLAAIGSLSSTVTFPSGLPAGQDIFLSLASGSGVSTNVVEIQYSGSFQCSAYNSAGTLVQATQAFTPTVGTAFPVKCSWDYLGAKQVCLSINNQAASCATLSGTGGSPTELDFGWSDRAGATLMDTVGLKSGCLGNTTGACP